jgi:hypothetical protein
MTEMAISPLRRRMIEDMTVRNFTADTQRDYIRAVKKLTDFLGGSPAAARRRTCAVSNCIWPRTRCVRRRSTARCRRCGSSSR